LRGEAAHCNLWRRSRHLPYRAVEFFVVDVAFKWGLKDGFFIFSKNNLKILADLQTVKKPRFRAKNDVF